MGTKLPRNFQFFELVYSLGLGWHVVGVTVVLLLQLSSLDEASAETPPYPYELVFRLQKGRLHNS